MKEGRPNLPDDAPGELKRAERILDAALTEVLQLSEQIALWRAIGTDTALHRRLGYSGVGAATRTVYVALQNSIVLGLAKLFDDDPRGLKTGHAFNLIAKPDHAAWLLEHRKAWFRSQGIMMVGPDRGDGSDLARRVQEWSAEQAGADFTQRMAAFKEAKRAFTSGEVAEALRRLKEMRHKEVAHRDLSAEWRTERPKLADLDVVFNAVRDGVWTVNLLLHGSDHLDLSQDRDRYDIAARSFTAVLRPETWDEARTAREEPAIDEIECRNVATP